MSARSIWKGFVTIGPFVNVAIKVYKATDERLSETKTNYLHDACGKQSTQQNFCGHCNTVFPFENIVRGVPNGDGSFTVLTNDELKSIRPATSDALNVERFVPDAEVSNPLWIETIYYVTANGKKAYDGYATLVEGLKQTGTAVQGLLTLSGSEQPVALRAIDGVLVLQVMRTKSRVRDAVELPDYIAPGAVKTQKAATDLAVQLIKSMSGNYDPTDYEDAYVQEFEKLVEAKRTGATIPTLATAAVPPSTIDLMTALRKSLDANTAVAAVATASAKKVKKTAEPKGKSSKKSKVA